MMRYLRTLAAAPATAPISTFWFASMLGSISVALGYAERPVVLVVLTGIAVLLAVVSDHRVTMSLRKDVEVVHGLINSQHTDLVDRIDQLTNTLNAAGVAVPPDPRKAETGG